jgi:TonB-dependent receptor
MHSEGRTEKPGGKLVSTLKNARRLLLATVSSFAVSAVVFPAVAQESGGIETVVVSGIRASLESAQMIKQNSNQVVDSITSTDIGALPDRNVAEALQRVPGVTLQRNDAPNDLTRMGSTGNSVFIRGMSWVQTTMNGRDEFSAINGRTMSFADISADLLSSVDVYKSPTASMIEGGIGGTIDLKTRKPFDMDGFKFAMSGDYTYGDKSDRALPSGNALISDRFNTGIGEFGILGSIDWQDQLTRTSGININAFDCWTSAGWSHATDGAKYDTCTSDKDHVMAPQGFAWRQMDFRQQRLASNVVLQWRPSETLEFTLSGLNTYAHFTDMEHYVNMSVGSTYADLVASNSTYNSGHDWTGGEMPLSSIDTRGGAGHNRTSDLNLNAKWTPNDNLEITADVQFVESSRQYLNNVMYTGYLPTMKVKLDVADQDNPTFSFPGDGEAAKASNYFWYAAMDHMEYNAAHSYASRIDAKYKFGGDGLLGFVKSVEAGFRAQEKLSVARQTGYNWSSIDPMSWGAPGYMLDGSPRPGNSDYTAADGTLIPASGATPDSFKKMNSYAELFSYQRVMGNKVPSLWVPSTSIVTMNTYDSTVLTKAINPGWSVWQSYTYDVGCKTEAVSCIKAYQNTTVGNAVTGNTISPQSMDTYAGYAQANFASENPFGLNIPIDGNIGVRYVHTKHTVQNGKLVMPQAPDVKTQYKSGTGCDDALGQQLDPTKPGSIVTSCTDYHTAMQFWGTYDKAAYAVLRPDPVTTEYDNILPSFNLRAMLSDKLQARLGYSESMLRPDFGYTNNDASLSFNFGDATYGQAFAFKYAPSGYGGNANLKPMHSTNLDASLEWYFSPSGSITMSAFGKRISNYIYTQTQSQVITNPASGQSMPFDYTTYVNGTKGGVDGWEIAYQQFYDFLPGFWGGFGLQANYTKIFNWGGHNNSANVTAPDAVASGNRMDLPMEGLSKDSYNLALLYAKYDIDFRLAWNWRSSFMSSSASSGEPRDPVWLEAYGQLDGSLFYTLYDHYKIGVQLTNITGEVFYTDQGYADYHPRVNWIEADRKFAVVLRTNF